MKLFYAPQSPFARKVRVTAIEVGLGDAIELEYAEVIPGNPNRAYADAYNPLRQVPALLLDDRAVLYDSTVICDYLDARAGGDKVIPTDPDRRWRVLTNHALAQGVCDAVITIRYETWLRPAAYRWTDWVEDRWDKVNAGLAWFESHPEQVRGDLDIANIALACTLGYTDFRFPDAGWRGRFPLIAEWYADISARPSFSQTVPKPPPGE